MKAIEFQGVNVRIAENQPGYETIPAKVIPDIDGSGFNQVTMCFRLNKEERKQVAETGRIWHTVFMPENDYFHPIEMSCLIPEDCIEKTPYGAVIDVNSEKPLKE